MPWTHHNSEQAFSLVELSIVLVILGLLAGGVLSGRALIRAAEIKSISTQYEHYNTALNSFRDKYMALPGDMPNATQFWGRMAATADCVTNSSAAVNASKGVCDGNGNGNLEILYGPGAAGKSEEALQFWRELANAGLIEGTYTGVAGSNGGADWTPGVNQPRGKISNTGWGAIWMGDYPGNANIYVGQYGGVFIFGTKVAGDADSDGPALSPEEAWSVDTKVDDGKPGTGRVVVRFWNNACSAADDASSTQDDLIASYRVTDTSIQCALYFTNQF